MTLIPINVQCNQVDKFAVNQNIAFRSIFKMRYADANMNAFIEYISKTNAKKAKFNANYVRISEQKYIHIKAFVHNWTGKNGYRKRSARNIHGDNHRLKFLIIFLMILRKSGFTKKKKVNQSTCAQGKKNMETFLKWKGYHNSINN